MSASLRKVLASVAAALIIYVGLSGPLAGLVCYGGRMDPVHHEFWTGMYERHRAVYFPLYDLAGQMGCRPTLLKYWRFWGWEFKE